MRGDATPTTWSRTPERRALGMRCSEAPTPCCMTRSAERSIIALLAYWWTCPQNSNKTLCRIADRSAERSGRSRLHTTRARRRQVYNQLHAQHCSFITYGISKMPNASACKWSRLRDEGQSAKPHQVCSTGTSSQCTFTCLGQGKYSWNEANKRRIPSVPLCHTSYRSVAPFQGA